MPKGETSRPYNKRERLAPGLATISHTLRLLNAGLEKSKVQDYQAARERELKKLYPRTYKEQR